MSSTPPETTCWRCKNTSPHGSNFCSSCGTRLRDTRVQSEPIPLYDVAFLRDLYSFSWYNHQVAAVTLYEHLADVNVLYDHSRAEEDRPLVEPLRTQKILRAKLFAEYLSLLEAFGMLCLAIRRRGERSIVWTFLNTEPQEVTQLFDCIRSNPKATTLQKFLGVPSERRFNEAAAKIRSGALSGFSYPTHSYAKLCANIRTVADLYRDENALNVTIYNKLKHGFLVVEGTTWFTPPLNPDHAHVLVDDKELRAGRMGVSTLKLDQEAVDRELSHIRIVTVMGAELLALALALSELGLLHR